QHADQRNFSLRGVHLCACIFHGVRCHFSHTDERFYEPAELFLFSPLCDTLSTMCRCSGRSTLVGTPSLSSGFADRVAECSKMFYGTDVTRSGYFCKLLVCQDVLTVAV